MKKFFNIGILLLAAACSATDSDKSAELKKLEAERDKLKTTQSELAAQLQAIDEQIVAAGGESLRGGKSALVTTKKLQPQTFEHFFEIQGSVEAEKSITMTAEMGGIVKRINVQEGQKVSQGQTIIELDKQLIEQNIAELKDAKELARFMFEKQEKLWKQNIGSELQYRQAKTNYESMANRYEQLQIQRSKAFISAPFSGVVEDIMPKIGEMAAPGMPAVRIVNLDRLEVKAEVSEGYLGKIKYGSLVTVYFPSMGKEYDAKIVKIGSSINPNGRTFEIAASISNAGKDLLPNLIAKIKVRDYESKNAVVVPSTSILQDINGNSFVYLVKQGKDVPSVKKHAVKIGLTYNNMTEVVSGLNGTEEIVMDGVRSINDGDNISINKK